MIATETKLWQAMRKHESRFVSLTRFESPITPGASDVEYTASYTGWVELKVCAKPSVGRPFSLRTPFTVAQLDWLRRHQDVRRFRRSYLLLGVLGQHTWRELILLEPQIAVALMVHRPRVANEELRVRDFVYQYTSMDDVMSHILRGGTA